MDTVAESNDNKSNKLFTSARELVTRELSVDYLVEDLIEKGTSGLLFGPSGEGKTFMILDLGLSTAAGIPWVGKKTEKGLVIYFCGEGHSRIPHRIIAWQKEHGIDNDAIELFHSSETTIELDNINSIINEIRELSNHYSMPVPLVIFDTLSQHLIDDYDENSTKDMKKFLKIIAAIRNSQIKCTSVLVHHPGYKDQTRIRGASSIKGTLDFEMSCNKGTLEFTKTKDGEKPDPISIKLKTIEIGIDKKSGKIITSAVVLYDKAKPKTNKSSKLNEGDIAGLNALIDTIIASEIKSDHEKMTADYELWRKRFYAAVKSGGLEIPQPTLNKQFNRMVESLVKKQIAYVEDSTVILLSKEYRAKVEERISFRDIPGHDRDNVA